MLLALSFLSSFTDTAPTEIYTLSLHDALPIYCWRVGGILEEGDEKDGDKPCPCQQSGGRPRSEEHTSELQSLTNLVCRLLLEKKKPNDSTTNDESWFVLHK